MWADVVDADTPNAAEMAEAEAGMRDVGEVPPLHRENVDALVALATREPGVVPGGGAVIGGIARARTFRQPMLKAAAAVLVLMAVAAVVIKATEAKRRQYSEATQYGKAVLLATEPGRIEAEYLIALGQIADHCVYAADTLRQLAAQVAEPDLADQALEISADLVALLTNGPTAQAPLADLRMEECVATALSEGVALKLRQEALSHVGELARSGLTAMLLAKFPRSCTLPRTSAPLVPGHAHDKRQGTIERILRILPR